MGKMRQRHAGAWYGDPSLVVAACLCLIFPMCLKEGITVLQYTSGLALLCLAYYFFCLSLRFLGQKGGPSIHPSVIWYNGDVLEVLEGFSIIVSAYICHFNIFQIDAELRGRSKQRIWSVIHVTIPGI